MFYLKKSYDFCGTHVIRLILTSELYQLKIA